MIYPEAGAGANRRRGGGATNFMHGLKGGGGGGALENYASVLPAKMLKAASGCYQQIQPIKIALYNNFY